MSLLDQPKPPEVKDARVVKKLNADAPVKGIDYSKPPPSKPGVRAAPKAKSAAAPSPDPTLAAVPETSSLPAQRPESSGTAQPEAPARPYLSRAGRPPGRTRAEILYILRKAGGPMLTAAVSSQCTAGDTAGRSMLYLMRKQGLVEGVALGGNSMFSILWFLPEFAPTEAQIDAYRAARQAEVNGSLGADRPKESKAGQVPRRTTGLGLAISDDGCLGITIGALRVRLEPKQVIAVREFLDKTAAVWNLTPQSQEHDERPD